ncbi:hypothetical protein D9M68_521130 [compost metagenome]
MKAFPQDGARQPVGWMTLFSSTARLRLVDGSGRAGEASSPCVESAPGFVGAAGRLVHGRDSGCARIKHHGHGPRLRVGVLGCSVGTVWTPKSMVAWQKNIADMARRGLRINTGCVAPTKSPALGVMLFI